MSELKEILSPVQLIKHYELLQFLSKRANTAFTLAQLDYHLPHGASLQRFPLEWLAFVRHGGCAHRNIELHYRKAPAHRRTNGDDAGNDDDAAADAVVAGVSSTARHVGDDDDNNDSDVEWHVDDVDDDNNDDDEEGSSMAGSPTSSSPTTTTTTTTTAATRRAARAAARLRARAVLVCRQPIVRTLAELQRLLQSPSSLLDAEGCVALHTDQVILARELLARAQRTGVAYYFTDKYTRAEAVAAAGAVSRPRIAGVSAAAAAAAAATTTTTTTPPATSQAARAGEQRHVSGQALVLDADGLRSGRVAVPHVILRLPPGVRVRYRLVTLRGVVVRDELALPTRLHVDERVTLLFDNVNAVVARSSGGGASAGAAATGLHLTYQINGIRLAGDKERHRDADEDADDDDHHDSRPSTAAGDAASSTTAMTVTAAGSVSAARADVVSSSSLPPQAPLRIRAKLVTLPLTAAPAANVSGGDNDDGCGGRGGVASTRPAPDGDGSRRSTTAGTTTASSTCAAPAVRVTQIRMELEALREARFVLLLDINGCSNAVSMQIVDTPTAVPGVLIARERQPTCLTLPPAYMLHDDVVTGTTAAAPAATTTTTNALPTIHGTTTTATTATAAATAKPALTPLPWWQNASPLMRIVRDVTYTTDADTVAAAMRAVYTASALAHEAAMQHTQHQRRAAAAAAAAAAVQSVGGMSARRRRRRARARATHELRNRHLLHYGIDLSLPFVRRTATRLDD